MGAVTVTNKRHLGQLSNVRGRAVVAQVQMSNSYATGGDTISPSALNFTRVEGLAVLSGLSGFKVRGAAPAARVGGAALELGGTPTAPTIMAFAAVDGADTQVGAATDISECVCDIIFFGR
jgi:hypothetical protein